MKKLLALLILALFAITIISSNNSESHSYLDFDDIDYLEIVKA